MVELVQKRLETPEGQPVGFIYHEQTGNPPYYYTLLGGLEPVDLVAQESPARQ